MRRTQFITAIIVAIITVTSLHIFVGPRYPGYYSGGWHGRHWYDGHRYPSHYYRDRYYDDPRSGGLEEAPPAQNRPDSGGGNY